ncbi:calpain family cysteine protease, partial [Ostertagia ostertagi]
GGGGGGRGGGTDIGSIIGGIGSLIGGGGGQYGGGGGNINPNRLNGGMVNILGNLIGEAAHRFLGVDPATGRIIGAVAGNVIMGLGGKDNSLGNIGKIILDNIISGKFRRDVSELSCAFFEDFYPYLFRYAGRDPFVRPEPRPDRTGGITPIQPIPSHAPLDFYEERDKCLQEKRLFEDPHFPAQDSSLFYSKSPPKRIEWLRPGEIVRDPQLESTEGHSRFDVIQNSVIVGCFAAAANLTLKDELFYRVVPPDQSFTENYAGIFHFQFWQYGKWVDVVVDDRLPTSNGELLYMHSKSNNELYGSYEALKGGTTSEALEDMTGGLTEFFDLLQPPRNLMQMMMRGFEMGSLFGCSIEADPNVWEAKLPNGLVKGHAYSITGMRIVNGPRGQVCLMRIRNPWGNEQEWNGPWSDNSSEWRSLPDNVKQDMGLKFDHDGEFWMTFEDFMRNFEKMEICNLGPDVMDEVYQMTGVRTAGMTTFANNPQYRVQLTDSDPDDDDELCTVIFAVMQKYRRNLKAQGLDNVPIGFAVYDLTDSDPDDDDELCTVIFAVMQKYRRNLKAQGLDNVPIGFAVYDLTDSDPDDDDELCTVIFAVMQKYRRNLKAQGLDNVPIGFAVYDMTGRFRVPPGNYVVVPSTFEPNEEAEFMLRIYTNGFIES